MQRIGVVTELWRYPVSSAGGERLDEALIGPAGFPFDRHFALVDAGTGVPAEPEGNAHWHKVLLLKGRSEGSGGIEIGFPDGRWFAALAPGLDAALSDFFGFAVALWPYEHADVPDDYDGPFAVNRYRPSPVHLVTTASLDHLQALSGAPDADRRRFRPNLLVKLDDEAAGFIESGWLERTVRIGDATLGVSEHARRCGMTIVAQEGIAENANILRTIVRHNKHNLGIYCEVMETGRVRVGDIISM